MKRLFNRRSQSGQSINLMSVLIVLAIVICVFVIIHFVTGGV